MRKWYKAGRALLEEIDTTLEDMQSSSMLAFWNIGQCGYIFKYRGKILAIDPMLNDLTDENGVSKRYYECPFEPAMLRADYVLCTHGHVDHLAPETIQAIAVNCTKAIFVVPGGCRKIMEELCLESDRVIYLEDGESCILDKAAAISVKGLSTAHPVHAKDEEGHELSLAYQIAFGNVTALHLGDTYLTERLYNSLKKLPAPNIFFPPINGNDFFRLQRDCIGNLEAEEAARLAIDLKADLTIPTHYDMIMGNVVDPYRFLRTMLEEGSDQKSMLPMLGERVIYLKD